MFETATLSYGPPTKRVWTTAMGFTGQALLIGCAVLAPLISPQTLGRAFLVTTLVPPGAPPPPPPPGPRVVPRSTRTAATQFSDRVLRVPLHIPAVPLMLIDNEPEAAVSGPGVPGGVPGGVPNGVPGGIVDSIINAGAQVVPVVRLPEVVKPPVTGAPPSVKPPRITQLRMATPIHKVDPLYPALAKQARVSGTVELLGVLGTDGRIHELKVLRGHPLLVSAALDAVRQWVFEPTLLNGIAVEVAAPITVNFILNQ
jgi:periplasmic protein TonB